MKHFIGGYALGFIITFFWSMERARRGGGDSMVFAAIIGLPFGLAAWGLM
jgi:hypothetical protein